MQQGLGAQETGLTGLNEVEIKGGKKGMLRALAQPRPDRVRVIAQAFRAGLARGDIQRASRYDPWFLEQIEMLVAAEAGVIENGLPDDAAGLLGLKMLGFSDDRLGELAGVSASTVAAKRQDLSVKPVYKRVDTFAAEVPSHTSYTEST